MPIKCESCKHYRDRDQDVKGPICVSPNTYFIALTRARDVCDREGDGRFVHFEPKQPTTGAALVMAAAV